MPRPTLRRRATDRAHKVVAEAMLAGDLAHPTHCEACLKTGAVDPFSAKFVWHHWSANVEHMLDVIPLCRSCHASVHAGRIPEPRTGRVYTHPCDWRMADGERFPAARTRKVKRKVKHELGAYAGLLGLMPDSRLASRAGVPHHTVAAARAARGIPAFRKNKAA